MKQTNWQKSCICTSISSVTHHLQLCSTQAEFGEFVLAGLCLADFALGAGVVVVDELVKEWRLVRTKPYQMDLDDALALSDEDALARHMQALKVNRDSGRSYYMEVRHWWQHFHFTSPRGVVSAEDASNTQQRYSRAVGWWPQSDSQCNASSNSD